MPTMSSRFLPQTGIRVWPALMTSCTASGQEAFGRNGDHVGPGRHDLRHVYVAQLDDALDHFPGVLLQQALRGVPG